MRESRNVDGATLEASIQQNISNYFRQQRLQNCVREARSYLKELKDAGLIEFDEIKFHGRSDLIYFTGEQIKAIEVFEGNDSISSNICHTTAFYGTFQYAKKFQIDTRKH